MLTDALERALIWPDNDLTLILKILFEEFEVLTRGKVSSFKQSGRIVAVIIYGRIAEHLKSEAECFQYRPAITLLVVVNDPAFADERKYWLVAKDRLWIEANITRRLSVPADIIVRSLDNVKREIWNGNPFFVKIATDGIRLFELSDCLIPSPPSDFELNKRSDFDPVLNFWLGRSTEFEELALDAKARAKFSLAAFLAHQSLELLYRGILMTCFTCAPRTHSIERLHAHASNLSTAFDRLWPTSSKFERRAFSRLNRAYTLGRYSIGFQINEQELDWIFEQRRELNKILQVLRFSSQSDRPVG